MNNLQIFSNEKFGKLRTVLITEEPWFVGKDATQNLGYENESDAISKHVSKEDKIYWDSETQSRFASEFNYKNLGQRGGWLVNESGLYDLIFGSKLESAKLYKRWVTKEVLPSIRKYGGYIAGEDNLTDDELLAKAFVVAQNKIAEREKRIAALEVTNSALTVENEIMRPKSEYFDELVDRKLLTNFRDTAKQLEVKEKAFISFLLDKKYVYRDKKGKLQPYAQHVTEGLFELKECFNDKTTWSGTQTLITPKGRETFRLLYIPRDKKGA